MALVEQELVGWDTPNGWVHVVYDDTTLAVAGFKCLNSGIQSPANIAVTPPAAAKVSVSFPPATDLPVMTAVVPGALTMAAGTAPHNPGQVTHFLPGDVSIEAF